MEEITLVSTEGDQKKKYPERDRDSERAIVIGYFLFLFCSLCFNCFLFCFLTNICLWFPFLDYKQEWASSEGDEKKKITV